MLKLVDYKYFAYTSCNKIYSSHKANNNCSSISSNQNIDEIKFLREELEKSIIIKILLENIFSNSKYFHYIFKKKNVGKIQLETSKGYLFKINDKTLDN